MASITFAVKKQASNYTFLMYNEGGGSAQAGVVLETPASQSDLSPDFIYAYRSAMLQDKRVAVIGMEEDNYYITIKCFLAGTTTLDWSYETPNIAYEYADICVLNNGNIVAFWVDYDDETPYFVILNSSGGLVQGVTNADTTTGAGREDDSFSVNALEDGGFCCKWRYGTGSGQRASIWNSNGTVRQTMVSVEGSNEYSPSYQMPSGGVGSISGGIIMFDASSGYCFVYDPTDLSELADYVDIGRSVDYVYTTKLSTWDDKVAMLFSANGDIRGSILKDDESLEVDDKLILSSNEVVDFIALPDGTFLMQYVDDSTQYGQSYYILDENLDISTGPHIAITGLTYNSNIYIKGCAG